jgi:hypothetical protein
MQTFDCPLRERWPVRANAMSWDVLIQPLPPGLRSLEDIPEGYQPPPIGARDEIISRIRDRVPGVDFLLPAWGRLDGDGFSIEFNLGDAEEATSLMLNVRGGDAAIGVVREVSEALGCRAIDCSDGALIDFDSPGGFARRRA